MRTIDGQSAMAWNGSLVFDVSNLFGNSAPALNAAPVASNDTATTHSPVTIDVLANDSDPNGDALSVVAALAPHGVAVINDDNTVTYTPNDGFSGQDTLAYTISDGHGGTASATVARHSCLTKAARLRTTR